jgi:hypothetical protein
LPIGLSNVVLTRQFQKKKIHGLADARGLTGAEIAAKDLKAREALAQDRRVVTPSPPMGFFKDEDEEGVLKTPLRSLAVTLAHRPSPEQPRRAPDLFRLFPKEPALPPASTAPPRLEEGGRGKRKRAHTRSIRRRLPRAI